MRANELATILNSLSGNPEVEIEIDTTEDITVGSFTIDSVTISAGFVTLTSVD